ncbi:CRTAC1 family protein [Catenovulum sp. 2E275]|uniref:CRTAC1 family protein n=1 Tax=Catenovulum sp. 2E275 TaxID=2980497 RepID=UPI0021D1ED1D|nr:CRTAC1 family protein [Catenovulum sp. 2E275]MCU4676254.1 CRTAC1 family protein [Catenovulum sp. 2E275]
MKFIQTILATTLASAVATATFSGCVSQLPSAKLVEQVQTLTNKQNFQTDYLVTGSTVKRLIAEVSIEKPYANLTLLANNKVLVDNANIPFKGKHQLNFLVDFEKTGKQKLTFIRRSADIKIHSIKFEDVSDVNLPKFANISKQANFDTEITYKYGGPSIGDIDADGDYDFVLNNHNHVPTQLVTNNGDGTVKIERLFEHSLDFHGSAVGDYDNDGDLDIMVAQGGANGTNPTSYILLKNDNQKFTNASPATGILTPARGRSPRWLDLDLDGDLDLALFNAKTPNYDGPIQLFYKNNGDGSFTQQQIDGIEQAYGERALITDFNQDNIDDIVIYSPITLWQGNGDFTFTDVTTKMLPKDLQGDVGYNAATDIDVNNDGLLDLYFAGSRTHYQLSRKSIDFNPQTKRLDVRDDGEKGTTLINFDAKGSVKLSDMDLTYRQYNDGFAIFLGKNKTRKIVKAKGFQPTQLPAEMKTAPSEMTFSAADAQGWPEERNVNGLYIGHMGNGKWQAEWVRDRNIYWTVTFSLSGLSDVSYDWQANNRNIQDILLVNQGDKFVNASKEWNLPLGGNSWGVTRGDVNNDGWQDLFVYRYGHLSERIADLLLLNTGKGKFDIITSHGAFEPTDGGHGDMGQLFDFDLDGQLDLLSGSEEEGHWYLFSNQTSTNNNYLLIDVNYSPKHNIDPNAALVSIETASGKKYQQRIGSAGEIHAQSLLDIVHFGLGDEREIKSATIRWRNGETQTLTNLTANRLYKSTP